MAEEEGVNATETVASEAAVVVPEPTPEPTAAHPLAPGGERFEEVIRQKNEARADAEYWRKQAEAYQTQARQREQQQPVQQTRRTYSVQELEAAQAAGTISSGQMIDIIAWQRAQEARKETARELLLRGKQDEATREVREYLALIPATGNPQSPEFSKVAVTAHEIADEMGLDVTDPRVQRRAFREAFGSKEKVVATAKSKEFSRTNADTHVETGGGERPVTAQTNPLANAPKPLLEHWKKLGYSEDRMKAELKYVDMRKWQ